MCILREFHGSNAYLCNNYINMFPFFFFVKMLVLFSIMAVFHVKIKTMPLNVFLFEVRLVPSGRSKKRKISAIPWFSH